MSLDSNSGLCWVSTVLCWGLGTPFITTGLPAGNKDCIGLLHCLFPATSSYARAVHKDRGIGVQETMKERPLNLGELCVVSESGLQCLHKQNGRDYSSFL